MRGALADAGLTTSDVGHVNAHGTSTNLNDLAEAAAIRSVFERPPRTFAPKSIIGHLIGAAGAVEAIISILAIQNQVLPPTVNLDHAAEFEYLRLSRVALPVAHRVGLSNSFGFGGINASVVLRL